MAEKLSIEPGMHGVVLKAPTAFLEELRSLPEGVTVDREIEGEYDFALAFVDSQKALGELVGPVVSCLRPEAPLWFAFPRLNAGVETDISSEHGWEAVERLGWAGVRIVALDDTWSAFRFRAKAEIDAVRDR
jgi:hypothetical protein